VQEDINYLAVLQTCAINCIGWLSSELLTYARFVFSCRVLIRPHPAIWRLVHGLAIVYLVALTFLLFQVGFLFVKTTSLSCTLVLICCLHLHILASPDFSFVKLTFPAHLHIHDLVLCLYIRVHACLCKAICSNRDGFHVHKLSKQIHS
jgi:hypothetical protein